MNPKIERLLNHQGGNYILPFFWQHGEDEATLRKYMGVIYDSNIRAVCVESRPHPDFCGPKWWQDLDVILDEARQRGMQVWILDDRHFPTGVANGALKDAPLELHRQSVVCQAIDCSGQNALKIEPDQLLHPQPLKKTQMELMIESYSKQPKPTFDDDRLLAVTAMRVDTDGENETLDLSGQIQAGRLEWGIPAGTWRVYLLHLSRNYGPHRDFINMMDRESCRLLIDAVYEPHYARYKDDFGKIIAGFFSDEPEFGNGRLYPTGNVLGTDQDLPWSRPLEMALHESLGPDFARLLPLLWENDANADLKARVRYAYMDAITRLVQRNFSEQVGEWCTQHGVEYIGHVIEDNNQHARSGSSLGHFFRSLAGQHMAGVDVVTRQVLPQAEDTNTRALLGSYDNEFFHFVLAKLGSSHAAIDPLKQGRTMCEIFGNYGWAEGVRLEKYLADHFMVRGINHYVPHAFSPKPFPDPDCPPHFYADGHDPQYRHFGYLMAYMNRVCELISGGKRVTPAAILYHGEAEWTGECMLMQKPARVLVEHQIDFDIIPQDVFLERERYHTELGSRLRVNGSEYRVLIVPTAQYVTQALAQAVVELQGAGFPVLFLDRLPEGICDASNPSQEKELLTSIQSIPVVPLTGILQQLLDGQLIDLSIQPASRWIRALHYRYPDGGELFYLVNEGIDVFRGTLDLPAVGNAYIYNAWDNRLECLPDRASEAGAGHIHLNVEIEPLKSLLVVFDPAASGFEGGLPVKAAGERIALTQGWIRSICPAIAYPEFGEAQAVLLPDALAEEQPRFSGFVRYDNRFLLDRPGKVVLEITDAYEGVEVFLNAHSCGIQVVPPFRFDVSAAVLLGENHLRIEVATTLERQVGRATQLEMLKYPEPSAPLGINGCVNLYLEQCP